MAETENRHYPLPPGGVQPNVPYWMKELGDAIDQDITALTADTGWIDMVLTNGWVPDGMGCRYRRKAGVVYFQAVTRPNTFAPGTEFTRLPVGFVPKYLVSVTSTNTFGGLREVLICPQDGSAGPPGSIVVSPATPGQQNAALTISGSFPID